MHDRSQLRTALGMFLLFMFAATYVHQTPKSCPTPLSRLDLLHAIFVHGTLRIDAYDNTPDKATYEGHTYSDKAPGTVVLALPAFALAAGVLKAAGVGLDTPTGWLVSSWIACAGSVALIAAVGAALLYLWLLNYVPPRPALVTTLALFLGAAPLPYSTMLFSHALVVGCIAIALWAISLSSRSGGATSCGSAREEAQHKSEVRSSFRRGTKSEVENQSESSERASATPKHSALFTLHSTLLLAGFACGWALASEYTAGIVVLALIIWFILENRHRIRGPVNTPQPSDSALFPCHHSFAQCFRWSWLRSALRTSDFGLRTFIIGSLPPLLLIPLYNWLCFGNPFLLPYSLNESFPAMREGLYAIKWPDPETAYNLLASPTRGLLFWTPFLIMAMVGYWDLIRTNPPDGTNLSQVAQIPRLSSFNPFNHLTHLTSVAAGRVAHSVVGLFWLTYAVPLLQVLVISGRVWDWTAGPTLGPRYLAPMLPLLAIPCALGVRRFPKIGLALSAASIALTAFAVLTDASPQGSIYNPLTELQWSAFLNGEFQPNLGAVVGLPPHLSAALYFAVLALGIAWLWRSTRDFPLRNEHPSRNDLLQQKATEQTKCRSKGRVVI